jgi:hypothetical protein
VGLAEVKRENVKVVVIDALTITLTFANGTTVEFYFPSEEALSKELCEWARDHPWVKEFPTSTP